MIRLWLDVPYRFVVKPAYERAQHAIDFAIESESQIYHDPTAGVVILRPSCFDKRWQENLIPLSQLEYSAEWWREARRGTPAIAQSARGKFLGRVEPTMPSTNLNLLITAAIIAVEAGSHLGWVVRSTTALQRDEGWALHISASEDEFSRDGDYWYAQWDRYAVAMDTRGILYFYRYPDRDDLSQAPRLVERWFSGVAAPLRTALTVACLPLPPLGLLILTLASGGARAALHSSSSTSRQLMGAKLIPLRQDAENIGTELAPIWSLTRTSELRLAAHRAYKPILAFERVRYPSSGYFIEKPHAIPPIQPQVPTHAPIIAYTHAQSVQTTPLLENGTTWNTAQSPTAYKMKVVLNTSNPVYTPIVAGHYLRCEPAIAARATTPILVPRLLSFEYSVDEFAREEGHAEILVDLDQPDLRSIIRRGDTTYRLEYSPDNGTSWVAIGAGFARVENIEVLTQPLRQLPTQVKLALHGMWSRFTEIYQMADTAFDGVPLGTAFNKLLEGCGFEPIPETELPATLQSLRLPVNAQGDASKGWRYAPRVGQSGDEILKTLLLLATASGNEWRLRYDAVNGKWLLEPKPDGLPAWQLHASLKNYALNRARVSSWTIVPEPPEANLVWVEGATAAGKEGERLVVQLVNSDSLAEPNSLDYLGRIKVLRLQSDALDTIDAVQQLADRLYQVAARHRERHQFKLQAVLAELPALMPLLQPPRKVEVLSTANEVIATLYVKRATWSVASAIAGGNQILTIELEADTLYESDPRG
jgi:hypothetical protein